ncbi:MAG: endolytic transglycosylase MltG, partial [Candidatus Aminicenantes bacterium]|nr:endolytic transglycosylase MltG [Candidatus Aminicenantes bacterium]
MRRRTAKAVLILGPALLLAGLAAVALGLWRAYVTPVPGPPGGDKVVLVVEKGSGVRRVADQLARAGVIRSPWPFVFGYKVSSPKQSVKAGEYEFSFPLAPREALRALVEGRVRLYLLTVPEGLTGPEVEQVVARYDFIGDGGFGAAFRNVALISDWDPAARDLEGYLFPDSYNVRAGS